MEAKPDGATPNAVEPPPLIPLLALLKLDDDNEEGEYSGALKAGTCRRVLEGDEEDEELWLPLAGTRKWLRRAVASDMRMD